MSLLTIVFFDFLYKEIPLRSVIVSLIILIALAVFQDFFSVSFQFRLVGSFVGAVFFLWQYVLSRGRWIGGGDIWVGAFLGFIFGWNAIVLVLATGYLLAAVGSLIQLLVFKQKIPRTIPLGGWLCVSGIIFFIGKLL